MNDRIYIGVTGRAGSGNRRVAMLIGQLLSEIEIKVSYAPGEAMAKSSTEAIKDRLRGKGIHAEIYTRQLPRGPEQMNEEDEDRVVKFRLRDRLTGNDVLVVANITLGIWECMDCKVSIAEGEECPPLWGRDIQQKILW